MALGAANTITHFLVIDPYSAKPFASFPPSHLYFVLSRRHFFQHRLYVPFQLLFNLLSFFGTKSNKDSQRQLCLSPTAALFSWHWLFLLPKEINKNKNPFTSFYSFCFATNQTQTLSLTCIHNMLPAPISSFNFIHKTFSPQKLDFFCKLLILKSGTIGPGTDDGEEIQPVGKTSQSQKHLPPLSFVLNLSPTPGLVE